MATSKKTTQGKGKTVSASKAIVNEEVMKAVTKEKKAPKTSKNKFDHDELPIYLL